MKYVITACLLAGTLIFSACKNSDSPISNIIAEDADTNYLAVPDDFPQPFFPAGNPYSAAKFELGRKLFYERLLSQDSTIASCSHCMDQQAAFTKNVRFPEGYGYEPQVRNGMPTVNAAYRKMYFWDGRNTAENGIEVTAVRSIWLYNVLGCDTNEAMARLKIHPVYPQMFRKAFGPNAVPSAFLTGQAIATFVRCMISGNSPYDKYRRGDKSALTESQVRGMNLFFSNKCKCSVCHSGIMFTDMKFHNTGTTTHYWEHGRQVVTGDVNDYGKFLTPSLRNTEVTGPWMSDGSYTSLEDIVDNYNRGGYDWYTKDPIIKPLNLNAGERSDLVSFLKALTDREFLNNKHFADPDAVSKH